jgi:hypothetical protein
MVEPALVSYVQPMASRTLALAHAELCDTCADLLPIGTIVAVDADCEVTCPRCVRASKGQPRAVDPWACVADPVLRDRLRHRHDHDQRVLISA